MMNSLQRVVAGALAASLLLSITACGSDSVKSTFPESAGYLPTRIEKISEGGVVPEGHEAKTALEETEYPMESFWGWWVRKDDNEAEAETGDKSVTAHTFSIPYESWIEDGVTCEYTLNTFPKSFGFYPTGHNLFQLDYEIRGIATSIDTEISSITDSTYKNEGNPVEIALDNQGLGHGSMSFSVVSAKEKGKDTDVYRDVIDRAVAYQVSGSTLVVGFTDIDQSSTLVSGAIDDDAEEISINELDYQIEWIGTELVLTFDGESVTYVPEYIKKNENDLFQQATYLDGYQPVDGIIGIDCYADSCQIMRDTHEGYIDVTSEFHNDGIAELDGKKYHFRRSEKALTLIDGNNYAVYSPYKHANQSFNHSVSESIYIDDKEIDLDPDELSVELFMKNGFSCDLDFTQMIGSGEVTPEFSLYIGDSVLPVKAVNPYADAVPLGMCSIAYFRLDEHSGIINKGDGSSVGSTKREDVEFYYEAAYEKKPDSIRYKGLCGIRMIRRFDERLASKGETVLDLDGDTEVIYEFDGDTLKDILIERPALLYNGLQDNLDREQLVNMNAATMTGVIEARDTVLNSLKDAFSKANANVSINESTGEIVMDNSVLFGYDSAELSDEGKRYLDTLMGTYASVVLSDEFQDSVAEVRFEGHTDSTGSYEYNLDLSQRRADAVRDYCMNESGLSATEKSRLKDRAKSIGYSFSDPVYDENGKEDAEASRRVAIKFFMNVEEKADTGSESMELKKKEGSDSDSDSAGKELTFADFIITHDGETVDTLSKLEAGNIWLFSGDDDIKTSRGISLGSSLQQVYDAYGDAGVTLLKQENFFDDTDFADDLKKDCDYYIHYSHDNEAIFFFLQADNENVNMSNPVRWIAFYKGGS